MQMNQINEAASFIKEKVSELPKVGLILGSGLGMLADEIENPVKIKYDAISGQLKGLPVIAMQGRFHFYEGYGLDAVTFPVRVMKALGVEKLVVTNAAGGVNPNLSPGDLMLITDHINNTSQNPLIGPNDPDLGVRFPDMSTAYDRDLQNVARSAASELDMNLKEGVYVWNTGPSYETPAEIKMLQTVGGDAVGMSTVPEVIVARHAGIDCLGISCISNMAAGILDQPLSHHEVIETTEKVREIFLDFVKEVLLRISSGEGR